MIAGTIDWLTSEALAFTAANIAMIGPIVFVLGFAESVVFLSLLVPSTLLFLGIGGLHSAAGGHLVEIWPWAAVGAIIGDVLSYAAGRYFKTEIAGVWPFSAKPEWYVLARGFFEKWGFLGVVGSKFMGMLRPFVPVVAGAMKMPLPVFLAASVLSSIAWAGIFLAPGYGISWMMGKG